MAAVSTYVRNLYSENNMGIVTVMSLIGVALHFEALVSTALGFLFLFFEPHFTMCGHMHISAS